MFLATLTPYMFAGAGLLTGVFLALLLATWLRLVFPRGPVLDPGLDSELRAQATQIPDDLRVEGDPCA